MINALYLRLSESDGDLGIDGKDESNSIENQRLLLQSYLTARNDMDGEVVEYVDDGYSGTNFNRPAFKQMIEDAKKGKIDVILVKDLSRLGRDYIVTGDYIEQIFPMIGVRFIAVNNGYDTAEHNSGVMGFDVAVNNLINTFYSRDLSKKIKSGISSKWRRGVSTSSHAPYGYDKSKTEKGKYVVDPEAAKIVRLIFEKAADGLKTREIARILNEIGVLPPWEYLVKHNGWKPRKMITPESERLWDCTKVSAIIRKYDYTGAMVIGRRRPTSVGGKNMRVKPKSEWTIVEDVNEPIVSKELFEQANMSLRAPNVSDYTIRQKYPLKGKLRCGNCRHTLSRAISTYKEYFYCAHGTQIDDFSSCCTDQYPVEQMENIVWRSLKEHISTLQALGTAAEAETRQQFEVAEDIQKKLHHELELLKEQKVRQYEAYADGRTTKEAYLRKKEAVCRRIDEVEKTVKSHEAVLSEQKDLLESVSEVTMLTQQHLDDDKISFDAVDDFIEAVYVYGPEKVEIVFRFEDQLQILKDKETVCQKAV